mgnify:CR=1 FL=1
MAAMKAVVQSGPRSVVSRARTAVPARTPTPIIERLRAELQVAFQPGRAVLRSLALEAVRQQQHEAVLLAPLLLGGDEVLVDDDLRTVDEIAELGFPQHQRVVVLVRVAVLVAEGGVLAEEAVVHPEVGASARQRGHGDPDLFGLVIGERGVALAEGAASRILAGQTDVVAFRQQRAEGQRFRRRPVEAAAGLDELVIVAPEGDSDEAVSFARSVGPIGPKPPRASRPASMYRNSWPRTRNAVFPCQQPHPASTTARAANASESNATWPRVFPARPVGRAVAGASRNLDVITTVPDPAARAAG